MKKLITKKRGIIRYILITIVGLAFGLGVYGWSSRSVKMDAMPMPFGIGVGVVMSGSMEPTLSVDDIIVVKKCDEYGLGDLVVFQQKTILIVHEIVAVDGDTVITRGSANNVDDEPMSVEQIKGKVIYYTEGLGMVVKILKSPFGAMSVLILSAWLLKKSYDVENKENKEETKVSVKSIKLEIERLKQEQQSAQSANSLVDNSSSNDNNT
jgi:signal peptidase